METDSNPQNDTPQPDARHQRRLNRYRTVAIVVIVGFICYELLPKTARVVTSAKTAAATLRTAAPVRSARTDSLELTAFQLGKSVSDYSAMRLLDARLPPGEVHEADLASVRAAIEARLSALQIAVDPDALQFTWKPGAFDSSGSGLVADALARKYGDKIRSPYLLGVRLMSARWRLARLQDTLVWETSANTPAAAPGTASENTPAAMLTALQTLTFALIGNVDLEEFQPPTAVQDLVRSENSAADALLLRLFSLDMAVETWLARPR